MGFQLSPGVVTSEIDLTTVVPAVATSTAAFAGDFRWGPADLAVQVADETQLVQFFGKPDSNNAVGFFTCANFLAYGGDLRVSRAANTTITSGSAGAGATVTAVANNGVTSNVCIKNDQQYFDSYHTVFTPAIGEWAARYPGALGNSLKVSVWANTSSSGFTNWEYSKYFNSVPGTSTYASAIVPGANDEMHIVVVDEDGKFTGTKNTVLETFGYVSKATDAKDEQGNSLYFRDVIYRKSKYVYATDLPMSGDTSDTWGKTVLQANTAAGDLSLSTNAFVDITYTGSESDATVSLSLGANGSVSANVVSAYDVFTNSEQVDISLVLTGGAPVAVQQNAIDNIAETRKDCVVFVSPPLANAQATSAATSIANWRNNVLQRSSSYAVMDSGWKYQYDKYNDTYLWVPLNGDIAGLCARTDSVRDPWFSPAGLSRGAIKNVVKLAFNPSKTDRDTLYKNGINPVVSFPGEGVLLFGDKTLLSKVSAFDRINVRRLFITLEKAISRAARAQLFEFNDEFTRAQFLSIVEPFLRDVKGRRGVTDYKVVCDETNNTPAVIDRNEFVGDIYIKPARSINFIQLNFVAVRTGVAFEEIVGKV